jgi:hypothetical protein
MKQGKQFYLTYMKNTSQSENKFTKYTKYTFWILYFQH